MFVFRPGPLDERAADSSASSRRREDAAARGRLQRDLVAQFPERLGRSTCARSRRRSSRRVDNVTLGDLGRRRRRAAQRRADPGRRGRDDQVPARLRGRDPADARRQHAAARGDAGARIRRARAARRRSSAPAGAIALELGRRALRLDIPWHAGARVLAVAGVAGDRGARRRGRRVGSSADVLRHKPLGDPARRMNGDGESAGSERSLPGGRVVTTVVLPVWRLEQPWTRRYHKETRCSGSAPRSWRPAAASSRCQATMENNTRQGDMADQASGNNEVHIQLKLKQTDAKILQAIEEALLPHREGHLRRLPRLRRADRRRRGSTRFPGRASASPARKSRTRETDRTAASCSGSSTARSSAMRAAPRRRRAPGRQLRLQQHLPVRHQPRGHAAARGSRDAIARARRRRRKTRPSRARRCRQARPDAAGRA